MVSRIALSTCGKQPLGLLDARSRRRADMQAELSGIYGRKKVLPDKRQQAGRPDKQQRIQCPEPRPRCCSASFEPLAIPPQKHIKKAIEHLMDAPDNITLGLRVAGVRIRYSVFGLLLFPPSSPPLNFRVHARGGALPCPAAGCTLRERRCATGRYEAIMA